MAHAPLASANIDCFWRRSSDLEYLNQLERVEHLKTQSQAARNQSGPTTDELLDLIRGLRTDVSGQLLNSESTPRFSHMLHKTQYYNHVKANLCSELASLGSTSMKDKTPSIFSEIQPQHHECALLIDRFGKHRM